MKNLVLEFNNQDELHYFQHTLIDTLSKLSHTIQTDIEPQNELVESCYWISRLLKLSLEVQE